MKICPNEMFVIDLIAKELMKEENSRAMENLRTLRRNFFVETGDIHTGEGINHLLRNGLCFSVVHLHDYNVPDFGITQRGLLVFEHIKFLEAE